jgi:nucleotide-binding universal stress UspA family protein
MKILVATDFSTPGQHAVELAAALARRLGDALVLVFAVEPTVIASPDFMVDVEEIEKTLSMRADSRLQEEATRLRNTGLAVDVRVERGSVAGVIEKVGREIEARLVVLGTHGRKAVSRFFLGSTAERIVLDADRPVLVARTTGDAGLSGWAKGEHPLRLLIGIDKTPAAARAVQWVRQLREQVPCDVNFVHFYWPPEQFTRLGIAGSSDLLSPDPETVAVLKSELEAFVGAIPGQGQTTIEVLPNWGDIGERLAAIAAEKRADLLLIGTHQRRGLKRLWLGSTLQPALHAAEVPVLCIPGGDADVVTRDAIPRIQTVVAATDLSSVSNEAVTHAYGIVENGGKVHLVYVHDRHLPMSVAAYQDSRGAIAGTPVEAALLLRLKALIPNYADQKGITTVLHIIDGGYVPSAILQAASRVGADAICLASHGRSGLGRAVMGSVAQRVIEGSDRPVYVIRGQNG